MHTIDALILTGYILGVFGLAWWSRQSTAGDSAESQYLAGKSLTPLESLCSIIATEVSALTFLGIPALAFDTNFSFVQIYIGAIFGRVIIALVFLPKVYDSGLTVYEVMARGIGLPSGQRTVAVMYSLSKICRSESDSFSGCILVSFLSIDLYGIVVTLTLPLPHWRSQSRCSDDIVQMSLFISGGLNALLIPDVSGQEWGVMMEQAVT